MLAGPESHAPTMFLSRYFDRIAIALSTICIVHCLAMPFLVAVLPLLAVTFGTDAHFHALMLWLVVPTSVFGFGLGYRVHRQIGVVVVGALAVAGLAFVALWAHDVWTQTAEVSANVAASLLLAAAHWQNFRDVRRVHRHV
jgi:hypothetical protein